MTPHCAGCEPRSFLGSSFLTTRPSSSHLSLGTGLVFDWTASTRVCLLVGLALYDAAVTTQPTR